MDSINPAVEAISIQADCVKKRQEVNTAPMLYREWVILHQPEILIPRGNFDSENKSSPVGSFYFFLVCNVAHPGQLQFIYLYRMGVYKTVRNFSNIFLKSFYDKEKST